MRVPAVQSRARAHALLAVLDVRVEEFLDPAAIEAHQVIMVLAFVEFEDRLCLIRSCCATADRPCSNSGQHAVYGGQADIHMLV